MKIRPSDDPHNIFCFETDNDNTIKPVWLVNHTTKNCDAIALSQLTAQYPSLPEQQVMVWNQPGTLIMPENKQVAARLMLLQDTEVRIVDLKSKTDIGSLELTYVSYCVMVFNSTIALGTVQIPLENWNHHYGDQHLRMKASFDSSHFGFPILRCRCTTGHHHTEVVITRD